ncbi:hypothetical protein E2562_004382 [Oryza meyeriana var. granulata]|uniref:Cation/H(+) antiporter central domain-containing protein n=1 Tax=Oryza meyeriana var. granulata TaxID=110450 RepID=A0A6G1CXP9_9ORYZ|nr:hypothetical protein E2562_004382 [Oryza meyeriana var. granulata]
MLTLSMVVITVVATPLIKLLYNPSGRFARAKRQTMEGARPNSELRVVACLFSEDHAAPLLDLIEASGSSRDAPVSLIVLHLTELVGHAASVLKPHKKSRSSGGENPTPSDRIVNAFRYFEQQAAPGAVTVSPYVAASLYSSMHHNVCLLAHSRKANLILLPFHKSSDGARSTANNAIDAINRSVLQYAPCSVAILVDHGLAARLACATASNSTLQRVAMYSSAAPTTMSPWRMGGRDEVRDEEALQEFWQGTAAGTAGRGWRRRGGGGESDDVEGSALTSGLSEWSEFPELGVLGDMLASAEFASKVSILVVQQQQKHAATKNDAVAVDH